MISNEELIKRISAASSAEELHSLLKEKKPELLNKLSLDDLNNVTGGLDAHREETLNGFMQVCKLLCWSHETVIKSVSGLDSFSPEDIAYIDAHYDSITVD